MNILIDENISNYLKQLFQKSGHDVLDMKHPHFRESSDQNMIDIAIREDRLIISHDKDFLPYMTDPACAARILLLSVHPHTEQRIIRLGEFLMTSDIFNHVTKSAIVFYREDEMTVSFHDNKKNLV